MSEEEKIQITRSELREMKQEWKKEVKEEIKEQLIKDRDLTSSEKHFGSKQGVSRREFLKKLGAGAIGLGALSLAPAASKITISDSGITKDGSNSFWHQGNLAPSDIGVDVEEAGSLIVSSASSIDFVGHLTVTDDGDGTATINADIETGDKALIYAGA